MDAKRTRGLIAIVVIVVAVGFASGIESYMDYEEEPAKKSAAENIHELYRLLLQRNALDNAGFASIPLEHLMIRKSQRSPSLRLRFGRSGPHAGVLSRPMPGAAAAAVAAGYDDNN